MSKINGFIGTYQDAGIYQFTFDETKEMPLIIDKYIDIKASKYLSYDKKDGLFFIQGADKFGVGMLKDGIIELVGDEKVASCYITQSQDCIYTANFHEGTATAYQKAPLKELKKINIQDGAGCHQVILYEDELWIPCLQLDVVKIYDAKTYTWKRDIPFPTGSGPRHGVVDAKRNCMYILTEHSCELYTIDLTTKKTKAKEALVKPEERGGGAAIRISNKGDFLYLSIRKINMILVFDVHKQEVTQRIDCGGQHPRDIQLSLDNRYLFVANLKDNLITVFTVNPESGYLNPLPYRVEIPQPVSIAFS